MGRFSQMERRTNTNMIERLALRKLKGEWIEMLIVYKPSKNKKNVLEKIQQ